MTSETTTTYEHERCWCGHLRDLHELGGCDGRAQCDGQCSCAGLCGCSEFEVWDGVSTTPTERSALLAEMRTRLQATRPA